MLLGTVVLQAGPANADTPSTIVQCKQGGNDVRDSSIPTSVGDPRPGLRGLLSVLHEGLKNNDILNVVPIDEINLDNVKLIENNISILSDSNHVSAPCR
jgi:hypothetical protein